MRSPAQEAFDALADPTRRRILELLASDTELSAGDIAENVSTVGRTGISSHLRILRTSGLIVERREGRFRYYSLDPEGSTRDALTFLQGILGSAVSVDASQASGEADSNVRAG